ncbi:MAG: hypothetical protein ACRD5B_14805, partial [Nitrososphaeraceae archaeon]
MRQRANRTLKNIYRSGIDDPEASKPHHRSAGLFHFAILTPDRKSLAATFVSLENQGIQFIGFADHIVSESLYLQDPEDNGIEIYCDRPREEWQFDEHGYVQMDTIAVDLQSLLSEPEAGECPEGEIRGRSGYCA